MLVFCAACGLIEITPARSPEVPQAHTSDASDVHKPDTSDARSPEVSEDLEDPTVDLPLEMVPLAQTPAVPNVIMPVASGILVESNAKAAIDFSNTADGYIMVKWLTETTKQLRVQVSGPGSETYTYTIFPNERFEVLPLSDGNGSYTVNVFEQTEGNRYALANSVDFSVTLQDEFAPFLRPNQFVNFNEDSDIVFKAAELVTGMNTLPDMIAAVYGFVISNITYDMEFAHAVQRGEHVGYLPDLDAVLARRKGICFDFAAVMTAMHRSQGIPTKLVIGYAGDVYHAWISVFSEETGWIDGAIFFDGESWILMDPTFASSANDAESLQAFIGDGSSYIEKFLY